jgi:hypothetical protein
MHPRSVLTGLSVYRFSKDKVCWKNILYYRCNQLQIWHAVRILGRRSQNSLYNQELVSMDEHGGYDPVDAGGFIRAHAVRLKEYYRVKTEKEWISPINLLKKYKISDLQDVWNHK